MTGAESKSFPSSPIRVSIQKLLSHAYKEEITWNWEEFSYTYFTICIAFKFNGLGGVFFFGLADTCFTSLILCQACTSRVMGGKKKPYYFIGYFKKIISSIKKYTSTKNNRLSQVKKVP